METIKWHAPIGKYDKEFESPGKVLKLVNNMVQTENVTIHESSVVSKGEGGGG